MARPTPDRGEPDVVSQTPTDRGGPQLRIHRFLPMTRVEGPGTRACLWVQGCPIGCPGCAVPGTWPDAGGTVVGVDILASRILTRSSEIEGVTFLGGEPFAQADALAFLGRTMRHAGLSVLTFTGYTLEHLVAADRGDWRELLGVTDLLIDGPYRRELADTSRPWVGSSNQRFHFLTDRYRQLAGNLGSISNRLEIRISRDGQISVNGLATTARLQRLFESVAGLGSTGSTTRNG